MKELSNDTLKALAADYFGCKPEQIQATPKVKILNSATESGVPVLAKPVKKGENQYGLLFDEVLRKENGVLYYPLNLVHKDENSVTSYPVKFDGKLLGTLDINSNSGSKTSDIQCSLFDELNLKRSSKATVYKSFHCKFSDIPENGALVVCSKGGGIVCDSVSELEAYGNWGSDVVYILWKNTQWVYFYNCPLYSFPVEDLFSEFSPLLYDDGSHVDIYSTDSVLFEDVYCASFDISFTPSSYVVNQYIINDIPVLLPCSSYKKVFIGASAFHYDADTLVDLVEISSDFNGAVSLKFRSGNTLISDSTFSTMVGALACLADYFDSMDEFWAASTHNSVVNYTGTNLVDSVQFSFSSSVFTQLQYVELRRIQ